MQRHKNQYLLSQNKTDLPASATSNTLDTTSSYSSSTLHRYARIICLINLISLDGRLPSLQQLNYVDDLPLAFALAWTFALCKETNDQSLACMAKSSYTMNSRNEGTIHVFQTFIMMKRRCTIALFMKPQYYTCGQRNHALSAFFLHWSHRTLPQRLTDYCLKGLGIYSARLGTRGFWEHNRLPPRSILEPDWCSIQRRSSEDS